MWVESTSKMQISAAFGRAFPFIAYKQKQPLVFGSSAYHYLLPKARLLKPEKRKPGSGYLWKQKQRLITVALDTVVKWNFLNPRLSSLVPFNHSLLCHSPREETPLSFTPEANLPHIDRKQLLEEDQESEVSISLSLYTPLSFNSLLISAFTLTGFRSGFRSLFANSNFTLTLLKAQSMPSFRCFYEFYQICVWFVCLLASYLVVHEKNLILLKFQQQFSEQINELDDASIWDNELWLVFTILLLRIQIEYWGV